MPLHGGLLRVTEFGHDVSQHRGEHGGNARTTFDSVRLGTFRPAIPRRALSCVPRWLSRMHPGRRRPRYPPLDNQVDVPAIGHVKAAGNLGAGRTLRRDRAVPFRCRGKTARSATRWRGAVAAGNDRKDDLAKLTNGADHLGGASPGSIPPRAVVLFVKDCHITYFEGSTNSWSTGCWPPAIRCGQT